jgi:hypothetical protein
MPRLYEYADRHLDVDLLALLEPILDDEPQLPFWTTLHLLHEEIDGKSVAEWALADPTFRCTPSERAVLEAELDAWFSVWEVVEVTPGQSVTLRDLLTGTERTAIERTASNTLVRHDGVLTKVVTYRDVHVIAGLYPTALPPTDTARVLEEMRRKLRRKSAVPVERLRPIKIIAHLVECWEDVVDLMLEQMHQGPELRNTDGDVMVLTTDHFAVQPEDRDALRPRLAAMPDVDAAPHGAADGEVVFLSPSHATGSQTILGVLRPTTKGFLVETNSIERADRLRATLEQHAGSLIRHRIREHPSHAVEKRSRTRLPELPDADREALVAEFIDRYYREWLDTPIPALGNRTPRAAVQSREGRQQVEVLLKQLEHRTATGAGDPMIRPDVAALRRALGL